MPDDKLKFYQYWVYRFPKRSRAPDEADDNPQALVRFLDVLGREKEPWQIKRAREAVRLYLNIRNTRPNDGKAIESADFAHDLLVVRAGTGELHWAGIKKAGRNGITASPPRVGLLD